MKDENAQTARLIQGCCCKKEHRNAAAWENYPRLFNSGAAAYFSIGPATGRTKTNLRKLEASND
jgi:hypothetical protein